MFCTKKARVLRASSTGAAMLAIVAIASIAHAQSAMPGMSGGSMPGMSMPSNPSARQKAANPKPQSSAMPMSMPGMSSTSMSMSMMSMQSSVSLTDPMSREGSGTAWLPDASPMYGKMLSYPNGNSLMLHGAAMPRYDNVGSKQGNRQFDSPNWFMAMFGHPLSGSSQLGLRAMISLDPITEGGYGYPLLYQSGETWHGQPLHNRQHPHDLFSELSVTYSTKVSKDRSAYLYLGYPGEPALGPPTYMHRLIAYDLADAPIGHHWEDATHVTFGVATLGYDLTHSLKIEASSFTGREPDENRYNFDRPRFDSQSARLDWNPDNRDALQISHGFIRNPEGDGGDQHRVTASWIYDNPLRGDRNFTTTLLVGQNDATRSEGVSNAYLEEMDYQNGKDTLFGRLEQVQKSGNELDFPAPYNNDKRYWFDEYTVGYVRDLQHGKGIDVGLGGAVSLGGNSAVLDSVYGSGTPVSFQVFLRFRPSRAKDMDMDMSSGSGMTSASAQTSGSAGRSL